MRNAVSACDGEVKAEIHEVRRDKTEVDQLADLSGTMEVERPRYRGAAAGATAGRPSSSVPTADHAGLDADVVAGMAEKEETLHEVKAEVLEWIQTVSGSFMGDASFAAGAVAKVNESASALKQMENITNFLNAARDMGVPESSMCRTPDLYEEMDLGSVVQCIHALRGAVQMKTDGPKRWADLSDDATDVDSTSTGHLNLDQEAAEQELLGKMLETMPRVPRRVLEMLRAEPGHKSWTELVTT